jgi:hypothetical protein
MIGSADAVQFFQRLIQMGCCKRRIDDRLVVTLNIDDQYVRRDIWKKTLALIF